MNIIEIITISLSLAADAFAVSISKGLSINKVKIKYSLIVGLWFGLFQFLMPLIGYYISINFKNIIFNIDHWISFILLVILGINMIKDKSEINDNSLSIKSMFILSIATSIDALTFGIAYSCGYGNNNYLLTFIIIGLITFITSSIGFFMGKINGNNLGDKSKIIGGIILIIIGVKILLEHLF